MKYTAEDIKALKPESLERSVEKLCDHVLDVGAAQMMRLTDEELLRGKFFIQVCITPVK